MLCHSSSYSLTAPLYWSWWYREHDGTPQHAMKINTSPNDSTTYQHAHPHADNFEISVYVFIGSLFDVWFLNFLCHCMVFSLDEFPANIYTFINHGLAQASNIHTLLTYGLSPTTPTPPPISTPRFYFFQSRTNTTNINRWHKEALFFIHICYWNNNIILETNLYLH